jgi:hypothetical protein
LEQRNGKSGHALRWSAGESEALYRDLLLMRKDAGFTPTRAAKAPRLRHLLGGTTEPFENLRERLVSAIQSLRDPEPELLLDVFGLTAETESLELLKDRRLHYSKKVGASVYTVADREAAALYNLRTQLITGWYPKSPTSIRVPASHNGVIQEFVQIVTVVNDRRWQETREHYKFIAAFDEADYLAISSSFPGRPEPMGDFTVRTKKIGESFTHQFWYKEPMLRGKSYDLRFRLVPDPDFGEPEALTEMSRAFHEPTRTASYEAVFLGTQPSRIWSYRGLSFFERPGDPQPEELLEFNNATTVRATFHDLYGGLHSGIAWKW